MTLFNILLKRAILLRLNEVILSLWVRFFYEQLVSREVLYVYHDKQEHRDVSAMKRAFIAIISGHMKVIQDYILNTTCGLHFFK